MNASPLFWILSKTRYNQKSTKSFQFNPFPHHFETVQNSKKLQTTTEMWPLKDFKIQIPKKKNVKKGETAHFEQFHLFPKFFFSSMCENENLLRKSLTTDCILQEKYLFVTSRKRKKKTAESFSPCQPARTVGLQAYTG